MQEEEAEARPKLHTVEAAWQPKAATPLIPSLVWWCPSSPGSSSASD
jgi:hypothetical protein